MTVVALATFACGDPGRDEARQIRILTVPPGDTATDLNGPEQKTPSIVEWTWEIDTQLAWHAYVDAVTTQLSQFHLAQRTADSVVFSRYQGGDEFGLTMTNVDGFTSTHIRVRLMVLPD